MDSPLCQDVFSFSNIVIMQFMRIIDALYHPGVSLTTNLLGYLLFKNVFLFLFL